MVFMALDHTREFFTNTALDPLDLAHTTPLLFMTRWVTHFCAPIFVLFAGTGAFLSTSGGKTMPELSRFLLTRGLWLILLEIAFVSPFGWSFSADFSFTRLQVLWAIGLSMVLMAGLIRVFPRRVLAILGVAMILTHNLFDGAHLAWLGPFAKAWKALHVVGVLRPAPHMAFISLYPLVPWLGVMALGYGAGEIMLTPPARRNLLLRTAGLTMIALFVVLRASNLYGDPAPWAAQSDPLRTLLSFLNCAKYPPSLCFLLMTLGPALWFLSVAEGLPGWLRSRLALLGRVPLIYYLLHLPLLHGLAVLFSLARYGQAPWLFGDAMAPTTTPVPPGYGYPLWVVYGVWIAAVAALYPVCRWYADFKKTHKHPLLSYL
jgi:uncharacterized membrane protein